MSGDTENWRCLGESQSDYLNWEGGWTFDSSKKCVYLRKKESNWASVDCSDNLAIMCEKSDMVTAETTEITETNRE